MLQALPRAHRARYVSTLALDAADLGSPPCDPALLTCLSATEEELHEIAHIDYDRVAIVSERIANQLHPYSKDISLTSSVSAAGRQSLRRRALRRCPRLRERHCHHLERCSDCLLGRKDWPLAPGQANCQGALFRKRHLVRSNRRNSFLRRTANQGLVCRWGPVNKPMSPEVSRVPDRRRERHLHRHCVVAFAPTLPMHSFSFLSTFVSIPASAFFCLGSMVTRAGASPIQLCSAQTQTQAATSNKNPFSCASALGQPEPKARELGFLPFVLGRIGSACGEVSNEQGCSSSLALLQPPRPRMNTK